MTWNEISLLKNQKTLEDSLIDQQNPESPVMSFDLQSAAKASWQDAGNYWNSPCVYCAIHSKEPKQLQLW